MGGRAGNRGFVLWDALLAFAIVALASSVILVSLPRMSGRAGERIQRHEATEFAFSKLEEYRVSYPVMDVEGAGPSGWAWSISEQPLPDEGPGAHIRFVRVEVTAWHATRPDLSATLDAVIARRAPE